MHGDAVRTNVWVYAYDSTVDHEVGLVWFTTIRPEVLQLIHDDEVNRRERRMGWVLRPLRGPCRSSVPWGTRISVRSFSLDVNGVVS